MLDLNLIKNNPEFVSKALAKKGWDVDFSETIQKMNQRVELLQKVEGLKAKRNQLSASVPQVKKAGGDVQAIFAEVKQINADMESDEKLLQQIENEIKSFVETLPNIPDEDLLPGEKENNKVVNQNIEIRVLSDNALTTMYNWEIYSKINRNMLKKTGRATIADNLYEFSIFLSCLAVSIILPPEAIISSITTTSLPFKLSPKNS